MESHEDKSKGKAKASSAEPDTEAPDDQQQQPITIANIRTAPPYFWPVTRQLIWINMGMALPRGIMDFPRVRLESIATPPNVNIAMLTIPLTAMELLTFFSRHINNYHLQDRFIRNGIMGADQAAMINFQRDLHPPDIVTGDIVRNYIKQARRRFPQTTPPTPCNVYTVSHWEASPVNRDQYDSLAIDYPLVDCGFGVAAENYPQGQDRGPFTNAVVTAVLKGRADVYLSSLDVFLVSEGIGRDLEAGYSDKAFLKAHKEGLAQYKTTLRQEVQARGLRWEW